MVELVRAYPVHDYLGFGGYEEVERGAVGAVSLVWFGQRGGGDLECATVGLGDEAAGGMGSSPSIAFTSSAVGRVSTSIVFSLAIRLVPHDDIRSIPAHPPKSYPLECLEGAFSEVRMQHPE
jgi:hypothetical protein